tara:strand:+ start:132 stop:467 length:336 start_codon:yes stop_codon:yes gene_type:complete
MACILPLSSAGLNQDRSDCHAPAALRHTKGAVGTSLVQGKSVTGFSNSEEGAVELIDVVSFLLEDTPREREATYIKGEDWMPNAITDANLITGQNPASSEGAARAVVAQLK